MGSLEAGCLFQSVVGGLLVISQEGKGGGIIRSNLATALGIGNRTPRIFKLGIALGPIGYHSSTGEAANSMSKFLGVL